mgnify:CR=1 FL=1
MKRLAIVLFNLGGPDQLEAVEPFLYNLFMDPAIIGVPQPLRWMLAKLISKRRAPLAQDIYKHIGGKSPLLDLTLEQACALETAVRGDFKDVEVQAFVCMRYWHPMSDAVAKDVKAFGPDQIIMLPLYPQFSTTTTESSFSDWDRAAAAAGITASSKRICCYPVEPGLIDAQTQLLKTALDEARAQAGDTPIRVLFSAHGLPKKIVDKKGDPYPQHVEQGAAAIVEQFPEPINDWLVSYQSRVGPLEWIGPSTDDEIRRAGRDGVALVILPIAFVSEHSETLVELDIEYKALADECSVKIYVRVPAVATHEAFINGLAHVVQNTLKQEQSLCPAGAKMRICAKGTKGCPVR